MIALLIIIVLLVVFVIFALTKSDAFHKPTKDDIGKQGENFVSQLLNDEKNSFVFHDILLFDDKTKKSSQIDHIVIRPNGVFVIETKNYAGEIYGNDSQLKWTQVLADGGINNYFYNPIKQNATHIYFLAKALKHFNMYISVVIFPRAKLYIQSAEHVCNDRQSLYQALDSDTGIKLSVAQMQNIAAKIAEIKAHPQISKYEHVQSIYKTQCDISNNICPRCGKPLVLRNGKNGKFYGCSGYPNCHFTKNI